MATPKGLQSESDLRSTKFVCVASSAGTEAQAQSFMERQWRHVTPDEAVKRLMGPDLLVTNRKDKEVQVQVLKRLVKQTAEFVSNFLATLSQNDDTGSFFLERASGAGGRHQEAAKFQGFIPGGIGRTALSRPTVENLSTLFPCSMKP